MFGLNSAPGEGLTHRIPLLNRLCSVVCCDWLNVHSGSIESYGQYSYVNCARCGGIHQPMPRYYAEVRFGSQES